MLAGNDCKMGAGISAAKDVAQQKPHISTTAGRTSATAQAWDSDEALESDEPSDSDQVSHSGSGSEMLDSDGEGGELSDTDSDGVADPTLSDNDDKDATATQSSLEERQAGMPAEPSGQLVVTPGKICQKCGHGLSLLEEI